MSETQKPFFSVIIPTYNRAEFIGNAVQSVLDQTFQEWELIIVDDASTDETPEILKSCTDPRIRVLTNSENRERSASRNRGIAAARGRYICFLDSDDYYLPEHLATLRKRISEVGEEGAVALSCRRDFGEKSIDVLTAARRDSGLSQPEQVIRHNIPVNTLALPREVMPEPAFDTRFRINEDVHLFARLAASGLPVHYFDDITSVWVCEGQNTKEQVRDYITPQTACMRDLFRVPEIRAATSLSFRRTHLGGLYAQLAHVHCDSGNPCRAMAAAFRALLLQPGSRSSRSALGHVLYSLPGGSILRRLKRHLVVRGTC